jgi:HK97 gp10 family phage protein
VLQERRSRFSEKRKRRIHMADFNISIEGLEETVAMLEQAPRTIAARGYRKALQAGANVIANAVEARTPIKAEETGGLLEQGELRESLVTDIELNSDLRGGVAEIGFGKNGHVALWVEYGHRQVEHGAKWADRQKGYEGKLLGEVPAKPFMRPAADASAEAAVDAYAESLKQTVSEEFPQRQVA